MEAEQVKIAKKQAATIADYRRVFGTDQGKRVLWDILKNAHIMSPCYSGRAEEAVFRDGERNVGLRIMATLKYDVRQLLEMIDKEGKEE